MKSVLAFAVLMSVVACGLAVLTLSRGSTVESAARPDVAALESARIQEVEREVKELRKDVDHPATPQPTLADGRQPAERPAATPSVPQEVLDRITVLEKSVDSLKRSPNGLLRPGPSAAELAENRRIATDPSTDATKKLAALKALRNQKIDGADAISHDVVLSMLDLANRSDDEGTRWDVYRNLHGVHDDDLRESMLRALASDPSAVVRKKVAEDIGSFLPDSNVENALRTAADSDSDGGVREAASRTLSGRH